MTEAEHNALFLRQYNQQEGRINQHLTPAEEYELIKQEILLCDSIPTYRHMGGYSVIEATPMNTHVPPFHYLKSQITFQEDIGDTVRFIVYWDEETHLEAGVTTQIPIELRSVNYIVMHEGKAMWIDNIYPDSLRQPIRDDPSKFVRYDIHCGMKVWYHSQHGHKPNHSGIDQWHKARAVDDQ